MKFFRFACKLSAWTIVMSSLVTTPAFGGDGTAGPLAAGEVNWEIAPPSLPQGALIAHLIGDPNNTGSYAIRLQFPAGYKIPPHLHSQAENMTIISGTLHMGVGDGFDVSAAHPLKTGAAVQIPAMWHIYAFAKEPTIVQVSGEGPFDIIYLNPDEDPRKPLPQ